MPKRVKIDCKNVLPLLLERELLLPKSTYRANLKIVKQIVSSKDTNYYKVWQIQSKKTINYSDRKLFLDNYRTCYNICAKSGLPSKTYNLDDGKFGRTEDTLIYSLPASNPSFQSPSSYKRFMLKLTSRNWLCCYDNETGQLLETVYLGNPSCYKYKHVDWDRLGETITIMSVKNPSRQNTIISNNVLMTIAWFSVSPLEFLALMEFDKEIFGKDCVHCNVSEGLLIVGTGSSSSGRVRLYDFYETINKSHQFSTKLGHPCNAFEGALVGSFPSGIPLNCKLKEAPPVLFEVQCSEYMLHFGSFPFHFVRSLPKSPEIFQVCDVANQEMVENGKISISGSSVETCHISFHGDDSGRIIHYSNTSVRFFKLLEDNGLKKLHQCKIINLENTLPVADESNSLRPRRAKKATRRTDYIDEERNYLSDEYENELDLYAVLGVASHSGENIVTLHIFDNITEKSIKTIKLDIDYNEFAEYELILDLDTMMIIQKTHQGTFSCTMYQIRNSEVLRRKKECCKKQLKSNTRRSNRKNKSVSVQ